MYNRCLNRIDDIAWTVDSDTCIVHTDVAVFATLFIHYIRPSLTSSPQEILLSLTQQCRVNILFS